MQAMSQFWTTFSFICEDIGLLHWLDGVLQDPAD